MKDPRHTTNDEIFKSIYVFLDTKFWKNKHFNKNGYFSYFFNF